MTMMATRSKIKRIRPVPARVREGSGACASPSFAGLAGLIYIFVEYSNFILFPFKDTN